jgi:hypothetical protein
MRIIFYCFILFLTNVLNVFAQGTIKPMVVVLDFETIGIEEGHYGRALSEILSTELASTNQFTIVERAQLGKILEEYKLQLSGLVDKQTAIEIGKLIGAQISVIGSITKFGDTYNVFVRFVNCQTGEITLSKSGELRDINLVPEMMRDMTNALINKTVYKKGEKNPQSAFLYSLFLPGAGQAYIGTSTNKIWLFSLGAALGWALVFGSYDSCQEAKNNADYLYSHDPTGGDPDYTIYNAEEKREMSASEWREEESTYRSVMLWMGLFSIGIHAWSAFDASSQAKKYNKERGFYITCDPRSSKITLVFSQSF